MAKCQCKDDGKLYTHYVNDKGESVCGKCDKVMAKSVKTIETVLEEMLDKYSFTRGYPSGNTITRDTAVSQVAKEIREIVRGKINKDKIIHTINLFVKELTLKDNSYFDLSNQSKLGEEISKVIRKALEEL